MNINSVVNIRLMSYVAFVDIGAMIRNQYCVIEIVVLLHRSLQPKAPKAVELLNSFTGIEQFHDRGA